MEPCHHPVLLTEVLDFFAPAAERPGAVIVDCTLGLGGHTRALLERFPELNVIGIDRDSRALEVAAERLAPFGSRARFARGRFSELESTLDALGTGQVRGLLADFGVSSMHLDTPERGFSFQQDGPLDMRMGGDLEGDTMTAHDVIQTYSEKELRRLLRQYGEELNAKQIARAIVERRAIRPLETTGELRRLIEEVKRPAPRRRARGRGFSRQIHPATKTFQALRIEVNQELEELDALLDQSVKRLESDGRLVLISYQSLEDRKVKHTLRDLAAGQIEPITGRTRAETQVVEVLTRKVVRPTAEEVEKNPRARSARLRVARKL